MGPFYTEEEAKRLAEEKGYTMKEDAGRGWRKSGSSLTPKRIVEIDSCQTPLGFNNSHNCRGGRIPIVRIGRLLTEVAAVIDKDRC